MHINKRQQQKKQSRRNSELAFFSNILLIEEELSKASQRPRCKSTEVSSIYLTKDLSLKRSTPSAKGFKGLLIDDAIFVSFQEFFTYGTAYAYFEFVAKYAEEDQANLDTKLDYKLMSERPRLFSPCPPLWLKFLESLLHKDILKRLESIRSDQHFEAAKRLVYKFLKGGRFEFESTEDIYYHLIVYTIPWIESRNYFNLLPKEEFEYLKIFEETIQIIQFGMRKLKVELHSESIQHEQIRKSYFDDYGFNVSSSSTSQRDSVSVPIRISNHKCENGNGNESHSKDDDLDSLSSDNSNDGDRNNHNERQDDNLTMPESIEYIDSYEENIISAEPKDNLVNEKM